MLRLLPLALLTGGCAMHAGGSPPAQPLAFPGAEGAGAMALGGRGGQVLFVTNLDDSGPGSLRAAVETKGPRTILFRTAGTIRLLKPLVIREGRVTIAGQSAPGEGITLRDHPLQVSADDVIVRFIRSRLGDESKTESDAVTITKGSRIILDHVSASWSVDETLSVSANFTNPENGFYDVTVQWSIISESLTRSLHAKGEHGYGSLIRGSRGSKASFHHNLWASHSARMPRPGNYSGPEVDSVGAFFDFRSNVFYNWGRTRSGYNADKATLVQYNFVDNAYVAGPNSTGNLAFEESDTLAKAYFAGNSMNGAIPADPWSLVAGVQPEGYRLAAPVAVAPVKADPAASAYARVLAKAGASKARDSIDARVVAGVRDRTGRQINSQGDVGGWPELRGGAALPDTDNDGMPDAWERAHGLNRRDAADTNRDRNGDGYTNLEEWLADLASGSF